MEFEFEERKMERGGERDREREKGSQKKERETDMLSILNAGSS